MFKDLVIATGMNREVMNKQPWKWSVEIEEIANRHYVRVIEDGVVSMKEFGSRADAEAFAYSECARLGLDMRLKK
ncbi:hypothetical protein [Mesorhizobium sp. WSM4887]|uniref:hypothetical protein n=1 Tax=Mesorhizobium sp. WSM4887 TaxID=3038543 RepID=UPI002415F96F|nr:hypothetical protein [Mesorhizobium sp. WSM4887]MDG4889576.1 hypothetical protein [Mesorhizobium sp. WSM4887]